MKISVNDTINEIKINRSGGIILNERYNAVLVVINRENRSFLQAKYGKNQCKLLEKWGPLKGHRKKNETIQMCAMREIEEESGLKIQINNLTPNLRVSDAVYYLFRIPDTVELNPEDTKEICDIQWKTFDELLYLNKNRALRCFIEYWSSFPENLKPLLPIRYPNTYNLSKNYMYLDI
tara:strand:+ start:642 stop:1175 length:534 start_codon:yes stop_codon:yes gene_type:complete